MFVSTNLREGMPSRLYRSPEEIRRDISDIRKRMSNIDSMLSVHNVLISLIGECNGQELTKKVPELEAAIEDADKSLRLLLRFGEALSELGRELDESVWILGK